MAWNKSYLYRPSHAWLCTSLAVLTLSGCSVMASRESPLKEVTASSPTVLDVYRGKTAASQAQDKKTARNRLERQAVVRPIAKGDELTQRYWSAVEPLQQRFARVPNPDLVMVVYPHLAKGKYPVPGYVTVFPMFERTEYAMPGEVDQDLRVSRQALEAKP